MPASKVFRYRVSGYGQFPLDMLRYDTAWPAREEDASEIHRSVDRGMYPASKRVIEVTSHRAPTPARWSSFGWTVEVLKTW